MTPAEFIRTAVLAAWDTDWPPTGQPVPWPTRQQVESSMQDYVDGDEPSFEVFLRTRANTDLPGALIVLGALFPELVVDEEGASGG